MEKFRVAAFRGDMVFLRGRVNEEIVNMWRGKLLITAACHGQMEAVKYLLSMGALPVKQCFGCTVIQEVANRDFPEILQLLVDTFPEEVCRMDYTGFTPLHAASHSVQNTKILLDAGADPNACASIDAISGGATPLFCSIIRGNDDVFELLCQRGATKISFNDACTQEDFALTKRRVSCRRATLHWLCVVKPIENTKNHKRRRLTTAKANAIRKIIGKDMCFEIAKAIWEERLCVKVN